MVVNSSSFCTVDLCYPTRIATVWLLACSRCQPAVGLTITCHASLLSCTAAMFNAMHESKPQTSSWNHLLFSNPCTQPCCGMSSICAVELAGESMQADGQLVCQAMPLIIQMVDKLLS